MHPGRASDRCVPSPPPRAKLTRRVPHPVLIGHAASLTGVQISKRCGGGVFAFNRGLIDKMLAECRARSPKLGHIAEVQPAPTLPFLSQLIFAARLEGGSGHKRRRRAACVDQRHRAQMLLSASPEDRPSAAETRVCAQ